MTGVGVLYIWKWGQERTEQIEEKAVSLLIFLGKHGKIISAVAMALVMGVCYWQQFQMIMALFLGDSLLVVAEEQGFAYVFLVFSLILGAADGYCDYRHNSGPIQATRLQIEAWLQKPANPASLKAAMEALKDGCSVGPDAVSSGPMRRE